MKFICFLYYDTQKFETLSPEELEKIGAACRPHDQAVRETGKLVALGSLEPPEAWKIVRKKGEKQDVYGEHLGFAVEVRGCETFEPEKAPAEAGG